MAQLLVTVLFFALPGAVTAYVAGDAWAKHDRAGAWTYAAMVVVGTLLWQGCWDAAGGVV
jgi:threonine/homoserine/homoserine lactone efflux protein